MNPWAINGTVTVWTWADYYAKYPRTSEPVYPNHELQEMEKDWYAQYGKLFEKKYRPVTSTEFDQYALYHNTQPVLIDKYNLSEEQLIHTCHIEVSNYIIFYYG